MSLKIGIVGLPNVGKSTLFSALTKNQVDINNYPFCTIKPNIGVVPVLDERLDKLHALFPQSKKINATVEFVDIAGLVKNAHKGEGLGNQFLSNIRNVDVIVEVVRAFLDPNVTHTEDSIDPLRDVGVIRSELILSDLELIQKRKERVLKEKRNPGKEGEEARMEWEILSSFEEKLNNEEWLWPRKEFAGKLEEKAKEISRNFSLLTAKPLIYAVNVEDTRNTKELAEEFKKRGIDESKLMFLDIKLEKEISEMSDQEREEMGLELKIGNLVQQSYALLGTLNFFTSGETETRAWTTRKGALAPEAASVIHSDFQKYFICAYAINYQSLLSASSWKEARQKGLIRTEGKEYQMQEGDVVEFVIGK